MFYKKRLFFAALCVKAFFVTAIYLRNLFGAWWCAGSIIVMLQLVIAIDPRDLFGTFQT
jgi:hypothetical protein